MSDGESVNVSPCRLEPRPMPRLLSVVIPAYNEAAVISTLRLRMEHFMDTVGVRTELIVVDDGSVDQTLDHVVTWSNQDPRVRVIGLARNFGHQAAVTAGLDAATGDAVVVMDADLQDPPEVVPMMLAQYCLGFDVVHGRRVSRGGEGWFKRLSAWAFYRLMRRFVHRDLPLDCGDFRLVSRRCLDALGAMRELHRFLRGMVAWVGFPQTSVPYQRPARAAGQTKYPVAKMLQLAWTAAVSFSPAPLRLILAIGSLLAACGIAYGLYAVGRFVLGYPNVRGWTSLIAVNCLVGGGILVGIGILGEYVGRIFEEVKGRPLYVISLRTNVRREIIELPAMSGRRYAAAVKVIQRRVADDVSEGRPTAESDCKTVQTDPHRGSDSV